MRTKEEMLKMTEEKRNSKKTVDRLVMDELLEMGFSYGNIGTHYLHESIVYAVQIPMDSFKDARDFYSAIYKRVSNRYGISSGNCRGSMDGSIACAFSTGNIDYILDVFKNSYDRDAMRVKCNAFIMTVRKKILMEMNEERPFSETQLRLIIQGTVENITDIRILEGMCNIVLSLNGDIALSK